MYFYFSFYFLISNHLFGVIFLVEHQAFGDFLVKFCRSVLFCANSKVNSEDTLLYFSGNLLLLRNLLSSGLSCIHRGSFYLLLLLLKIFFWYLVIHIFGLVVDIYICFRHDVLPEFLFL